MDVWQFRVRNFKKLVRGWAANQVALLNKTKASLTQEYNVLDKISKERVLDSIEGARLKFLEEELDKYWRV